MATPDPWGLAGRRLYLCTPDRPHLDRFVEGCIMGGVDLVQLREKHLDDLELARRASAVQRVCGALGVPFILNDRPDLAAAWGADGVHVGQDDVSPVEARRQVGDQAIVGLSTHAVSELEAALGVPGGGPGGGADVVRPASTGEPAPIDYVSAGPVSPTPTKPGRPGTGLGYITQAVTRSPWTVWVTGGADPSTVPAMAAAGARHFVTVRWLTEAEDPLHNARQLRRAIDDAVDRAAASG
jgi:thiamine-phosphate pyrophosphorylase